MIKIVCFKNIGKTLKKYIISTVFVKQNFNHLVYIDI